MDTIKSPISILQERAMSLGIPLPTYNILQEGASFKCTVAIDKIVVTGIGANKKSAKHNAAEKAINILLPDNQNRVKKIVDKIDSSPKNIVNSALNAVGKLNELCSKHCNIYPDYQDVGFVNMNFIVKCTLFHHETEGIGRTKKEAKQGAALEMLNKVTEEDFQKLITDKNSNTNQVFSEADETIFEIFKRLSTGRKRNTDTVIGEIPKKNLGALCLKGSDNVNVLKEELEKLNFTFKISVLQSTPLILCLKTDCKNGTGSYTFLHSGLTYEKTELDLLKKAVNGIYIILK